MIVVVNLLHGGHDRSAGGSAVVSAAPVLSPSPSPSTPTPTPTVVRTTTPAPVAVTTPPPGRTTVVVYNVSRVAGRGALAAARLRGAGYVVPIVAGRSYRTPATVVYFDPGNLTQQAAARGLVARHLGFDNVLPRPAGVPAVGGLIVLVVGSYG